MLVRESLAPYAAKGMQMRLDKFVIDETKPAHVAWWSAPFDVPEDALLAAIHAVGRRPSVSRWTETANGCEICFFNRRLITRLYGT